MFGRGLPFIYKEIPVPLRGWITLLLATVSGGGSLHAQAPGPHPAAVWQLPPATWRAPGGAPADRPARSSGCGEACSLGATIGIITGGIAGFYVGALRESHTGWPILIGAIAGGLTGAMVGSGLDNDAPPKVDSTRVAGP